MWIFYVLNQAKKSRQRNLFLNRMYFLKASPVNNYLK